MAGVKKVIGTIFAALLAVGIISNWIMGALGYGPERHIYPYEHLVNAAAAPEIWCNSYQDWLITTSTGTCKGFEPPASLAKGQSFKADGTSHLINVIIAIQIDRDNVELRVHKGDWYCAAAERLEDLNSEGKSWRRTWLFSPRS